MEINKALLNRNIICMENGISLLLLLVIVPVFLWRQGHRAAANFGCLLAGAVGSFVTVRVLELGLHMVCIMTDSPVSRFLNGHTWTYVLYGT